MINDLQDIKVWHCNKDTSNKVWGHFKNGNQHWVFWGAVGANWTFKNHGPTGWFDIARLANQKERKDYFPVDLAYLNNLDPFWQERFNERFVYFCLTFS